MNEQSTVIDLLRHGETLAGKCFLGSTNAELTDRGWQQMHNAITEHAYDLVIASPLLRCANFARYYADEHNLPLLIEQDLREIHFGDWEAKTSEQLWPTDQQALQDFWNDPFANTPPQAEPMVDFVQRVDACHEHIRQSYADKNILLVAHAGVIKVMICSVLRMSPADMQRLTIDHGGLSRITQWFSPQMAFVNR